MEETHDYSHTLPIRSDQPRDRHAQPVSGGLRRCHEHNRARRSNNRLPAAHHRRAAVRPPLRAGALTKVKLQLKWLNQAQFAGYYLAADKGYYKDMGLDVELLPGGPDVVPSQKVLTGAADIGIDWVGSLLANRDKGQPLVDIGQFYQSSGMLLISKKTANINSVADLKGKKVGVWTGGNEYEFRAVLDKYKLDNSIDNNKDMTVIKQGFEMDSFLNGQLDAASAMTYNEYQVVLEAGVKPEDLNVINYNTEGVGMLEDHVFVTEDTLKNKKDMLAKFLAASQKGWQDAVKDPNAAVDAAMKRADAATTSRDHQVSMMQGSCQTGDAERHDGRQDGLY